MSEIRDELELRIAELEARQAINEAILEVSRGLNTALDEDELLQALAAPARAAGAARAHVAYINLDEAGRPEWTETVAVWQQESIRGAPVGARFYLPDFSATQLWISNPNRPIISPDIAADERLDEDLRDMIARMGAKSCAWISVTQSGRWVAQLVFAWSELHEFGEQEIAIYDALAALAGPAIENRRIVSSLEQIVQEKTAALTAAQQRLQQANARLEQQVQDLRQSHVELQRALAEIKTLSGLLPICAQCKRIRDDTGYWHSVETYVRDHSHAQFSHAICPDCLRELYPEYTQEGEPPKQ